MTAEIFEERVYNTVGDEYTIIKSFVDQKTKVVIRHELCGNIQEYKPSHFLDGQRCKYCGKESKSWEDSLKLLAEYKKRPEIQTFLKGMNIKVNLLEDGYSPKERVLEMEN